MPFAYSEQYAEATDFSRSDLSIAENRNFYLCTQALFKLHPDFDQIVGDILEADPNGVVGFFEQPKTFRTVQDAFLKRIRAANSHRSSVLDRIKLLPRLPRPEFVGLIQDADVVLDSIHFNGGNTTLQTLSAGAPMVTMPGQMMRGRLTQAPLRQLGLQDEMSVNNMGDYVRRAVEIGTNRDLHCYLKSELLERRDLLFETGEATRCLQDLIESENPNGQLVEKRQIA